MRLRQLPARALLIMIGLGLLNSGVHVYAAGHTGAVVATVPLYPHSAAIAVDEVTRHVFVASVNKTDDFGHPTGMGSLTMLDATSGKRLRTVPIAEGPQAMAVDTRAGRIFVLSLGAVDKYGQSTSRGTLTTIDARTGAVLHAAAVGGGDTNSWPCVCVAVDEATARVFVANYKDGTVSVLDAGSGAVLATIPTGDRPQHIAVDTRAGRVFVLNFGDGTVKMLDAQSGKLLGTVPGGVNPSALAVDERLGRLFVANNRQDNAGNAKAGAVTIIDTRTGKALHTATVGKEPYSMAVDERIGHVFVVNSNTGGTSSLSTLDAPSGKLLHTTPVRGDSIEAAVDTQQGRVVVASELSGVVVVDAASGAPLGSTNLDTTGLVAIDEATGHAFVTGNSFPCTVSVLDLRG